MQVGTDNNQELNNSKSMISFVKIPHRNLLRRTGIFHKKDTIVTSMASLVVKCTKLHILNIFNDIFAVRRFIYTCLNERLPPIAVKTRLVLNGRKYQGSQADDDLWVAPLPPLSDKKVMNKQSFNSLSSFPRSFNYYEMKQSRYI